MSELLRRADLFYFAGVFTVPPTLKYAMLNGPLFNLLRERVQYGQCSFFGVCGGALLSGQQNSYDLPGLDIFDGLSVRYDANVSANQVTVHSNVDTGVLHMTTGCAIVFIMEHAGQNSAISFATIQNHTQWWRFAAENTRRLQRIIDAKMTDWKPYSNNDEEWCFNLRGYIWRSPPPRRTLTTGRPPRPGQATVNEATKQDEEPNQPCATARPMASRGERMVQRTTTHGTQRATHPGETHVEATQAEITGIHSVQRWQGYLVLKSPEKTKHWRGLGAGSMKGRAA